jgi:hypothetical protein
MGTPFVFAHISVAGADNDTKIGGGSTFAGIDTFGELQQANSQSVDTPPTLLNTTFDHSSEGDGPSLIQSLIQGMGYALDFNLYSEIRKKNIDTSRTREKIKMVHTLAKEGVKWNPNGRPEIAEARRSFLRLKADYTVEFIWIMSRYKACKRQNMEELIRTPSIRALISDHMKRVKALLDGFNDDGDSASV